MPRMLEAILDERAVDGMVMLHRHRGAFVAVTGAAETEADGTTWPANVTSKAITVDHARIACRRSFAQVRAALELDPNMLVALGNGDEGKVKEQLCDQLLIESHYIRQHPPAVSCASNSAVQWVI